MKRRRARGSPTTLDPPEPSVMDDLLMDNLRLVCWDLIEVEGFIEREGEGEESEGERESEEKGRLLRQRWGNKEAKN